MSCFFVLRVSSYIESINSIRMYQLKKKKKKIEKVESIRLFHRIVIIISKILTSTLFLHHFPFMRSEIKILEEDLDRRIRLKSDRLVFLSSSTG